VPALPWSILEPLWCRSRRRCPPARSPNPLGYHRPRIPDRIIFDKLTQLLVR
jgi:hypothetical protein